MKILGVERLDIPESVRTILPEQSEKMSPEPETGVRQEPEETPSQVGVRENLSGQPQR